MASLLTGGFSDQSSSGQSASTTTGSNSGTSTATKNLTPSQFSLMNPTSSTIMQMMQNPQSFVNPSRQAAVDQVNQTYAGVPDQIRQQFLTTGGGQSGKQGAAQLQSGLARAGSIAGADTAAQTQAAQMPMSAAELAEAFLGENFGQTTTTSGTQTQDSTGTQSGSQMGFSVGGGVGSKAS